MDIVRMTLWGKKVDSLIPWFGKEYEKIAQYCAGSGSICIFADRAAPGEGSGRAVTVILDFRMVNRCAVVILSGNSGRGLLPSGAPGPESAEGAGSWPRLREFCRKQALVIEELSSPAQQPAAMACPE